MDIVEKIYKFLQEGYASSHAALKSDSPNPKHSNRGKMQKRKMKKKKDGSSKYPG